MLMSSNRPAASWKRTQRGCTIVMALRFKSGRRLHFFLNKKRAFQAPGRPTARRFLRNQT
jgi:hypothetical protein